MRDYSRGSALYACVTRVCMRSRARVCVCVCVCTNICIWQVRAGEKQGARAQETEFVIAIGIQTDRETTGIETDPGTDPETETETETETEVGTETETEVGTETETGTAGEGVERGAEMRAAGGRTRRRSAKDAGQRRRSRTKDRHLPPPPAPPARYVRPRNK